MSLGQLLVGRLITMRSDRFRLVRYFITDGDHLYASKPDHLERGVPPELNPITKNFGHHYLADPDRMDRIELDITKTLPAELAEQLSQSPGPCPAGVPPCMS
jgi:hypothetical protein